MKVKCDDGKVRDFTICLPCDGAFKYTTDSFCKECDFSFGVHDTKILKPRWEKHVCKRKATRP